MGRAIDQSVAGIHSEIVNMLKNFFFFKRERFNCFIFDHTDRQTDRWKKDPKFNVALNSKPHLLKFHQNKTFINCKPHPKKKKIPETHKHKHTKNICLLKNRVRPWLSIIGKAARISFPPFFPNYPKQNKTKQKKRWVLAKVMNCKNTRPAEHK